MPTLSCWRNASFAFFLVTFVVFIVAFSAPYWIQESNITQGLWQTCVIKSTFFDDCSPRVRIGGDAISVAINFYVEITRAMMCMSLISQVASFIMYCLWVSKNDRFLREKIAGTVGIWALSLALIGGVFNLVAVCVYRGIVLLPDVIARWSYWSACATTGALLLNSITMLPATRFCFGTGSKGSPPSANPPMKIIAGQPSAPTPLRRQAMDMHQTPPVGGAYYVAPPMGGYPTLVHGAPLGHYY